MDSPSKHFDDLVEAANNNREAMEQNIKLQESLNKNVELLERTKVSNDFTVSSFKHYFTLIKVLLYCKVLL